MSEKVNDKADIKKLIKELPEKVKKEVREAKKDPNATTRRVSLLRIAKNAGLEGHHQEMATLVDSVVEYKCPVCEATVGKDEAKCPECGAEFIDDAAQVGDANLGSFPGGYSMSSEEDGTVTLTSGNSKIRFMNKKVTEKIFKAILANLK